MPTPIFRLPGALWAARARVRQPWWDEASEIKLQRFSTLEELADAEVAAIEGEQPRYNVIHAKHTAPPTSRNKPRGRRAGKRGTVYQRIDGCGLVQSNCHPLMGSAAVAPSPA
jgi:hypothetical protein